MRDRLCVLRETNSGSTCWRAHHENAPFATDEDNTPLNNNRNNNRRRGRGNRGNQGGSNQLNRIDSRARGNAPQMLDKYKKLAQDAQHNGDRVQAEYYLQFADHYFRVIADNKSRQDEARAKRNEERGQANEDGEDGEDGDTRRGDNRRSNNRRPRNRRDERDNAPSDEGEAGVEGETVSAEEEAPKPQRRTRKPTTDAGDDETARRPARKPRRTSRSKDNADEAGEIDSSVLPPAISADGDDGLEAVG